ncbi:histone deacetylase [Leptospira sp. GIMC2001]|nr:histone deacetylase [Leptospira sp. GIMC2001]WCL48241.1 histone deacetylase [Leptospira sp. GIMC2001]
MKKSNAVLFYSPYYNLDLGRHVFPAQKYSYIYDWIRKDPILKNIQILAPERAKMEDLELVHRPEYLDDLFSYEHSFRTMNSELPLSRSIVESFLYGVGGTVEAMEKTSEFQFCFNLGGGYHHSMPDHAEGFCYLNDVAIATRLFLLQNPGKKVLIADLDLHQGNGNSFIFQDDSDVFTFSIHQGNIYPKKEDSDLDIALAPGTGDEEYLRVLDESLAIIESKFLPDIIFYLAGADPYMDDSLGELKLSLDGLIARDTKIRDFSIKHNVSTVIVTAGGYANHPEDTVKIHFNSIKVFCSKD